MKSNTDLELKKSELLLDPLTDVYSIESFIETPSGMLILYVTLFVVLCLTLLL